ncbi:MAG TPA: U32 family peptidase [Bacilli bacterium]
MTATLDMPKTRATKSGRTLKRPELLAPAGNLEKLKFAVHYGADAVYIGGQKYGLRSNADNFTLDEMREGVAFARQYGAKVFVAANIYAHNEDLDGIPDYLRGLQEAGISAIIAADPAIIEAAKQAAPQLEIHLSTQQSTMNWQAVRFWKEEGLSRVVLAREVSLADIREIKRRVDIEIETFIHGAMCSSFSGRCVLSNHFTGRDSNRGGCCQSCRWKYDLYEQGGQKALDDFAFQINDQDDDPFAMSAKDMGMIEHVPALINAEIDSFKIEGRMRSLHYVATVVSAYRRAIDAYLADPDHYELQREWVEDIWKAANRPLNTGFYFGKPGHEDHIYGEQEKAAAYDFAGVVLDYDEESKCARIQQRNHFKTGQEIEFFGPSGTLFRQTVTEIRDEEGNRLDAARHPLQIVRVRTDQPVAPLNLMRKRI